MAKYDITYSCGHKGTVELFGKTSERENKIAWYERDGLCPECYKATKRAEEAEKPLTLTIDCDPYQQTIILHFSGNTMPYKDQIKALGYYWGEMPMHGMFGLLATKRPPLVWYKTVALDDLESAMKQAEELQPKLVNHITDVDIITFQTVKAKADEKQAKIAAIKKPVVPSQIAGKKWNQTIYGKSGNKTIYPDGIKTPITDEEAADIEKYLDEKTAYKKAIAEIN